MSSTDDAAAVIPRIRRRRHPESAAGDITEPGLTWHPDRYLDRYEIATIPSAPTLTVRTRSRRP